MRDDIFLSFINTWVDVNTALRPIQRLEKQLSIVRPPIECAYQALGNQKNLKVNTIYGIGGFYSLLVPENI